MRKKCINEMKNYGKFEKEIDIFAFNK